PLARLGESRTGRMPAHSGCNRYKSDAKAHAPRVLVAPEGAPVADALRLVGAIALVRDLVNTPAADMGPEALAAAVRDTVEPYGAQVRELVGDARLAENFRAVRAVGRGAGRAPALIDGAWGDGGPPEAPV